MPWTPTLGATDLTTAGASSLRREPAEILKLWAGAALPSPKVIQRNEISHGVSIYAFPVQQVLAMAGLAMLCTLPVAAASWFLVERPALRRARKSTQARRTPDPVPANRAPTAGPGREDTPPVVPADDRHAGVPSPV